MKNRKNLIPVIALALTLLFGAGNTMAQEKVINVSHFEKVNINPHIEVVLKKGNEEKVSIEKANISLNKIEAKVVNKILRVSLEGWETYKNNDHFRGKKAVVTIYYKNLNEAVLKGEAKIVFQDKLEADIFKLRIYGDSPIYMNHVNFGELECKIYGDNYLEIKSGSIDHQDYTVFGDSEINTIGIANNSTEVLSFGDAHFRLKVEDDLKVAAFGDATVAYSGNPRVRKGIVLGDIDIYRAR